MVVGLRATAAIGMGRAISGVGDRIVFVGRTRLFRAAFGIALRENIAAGGRLLDHLGAALRQIEQRRNEVGQQRHGDGAEEWFIGAVG
jgi:hypothetical protein